MKISNIVIGLIFPLIHHAVVRGKLSIVCSIPHCFLQRCSLPRRRRICPGIVLAEKEIFLGIAYMLWAFKIDPVPGDPIDLKEYDGLSGRSPVPFRVKLTPRGTFVQKVLGV